MQNITLRFYSIKIPSKIPAGKLNGKAVYEATRKTTAIAEIEREDKSIDRIIKSVVCNRNDLDNKAVGQLRAVEQIMEVPHIKGTPAESQILDLFIGHSKAAARLIEKEAEEASK